VNWFTILPILSKTARGFGLALSPTGRLFGSIDLLNASERPMISADRQKFLVVGVADVGICVGIGRWR
jgi:hypothetical protein